MPDITVYTAITGQKDDLLLVKPFGDEVYRAWTDMPQPKLGWGVEKACDRFKDPRRNSRIQKILAHHFIDTEYSVYLDGNVRLLRDPKELIEKYLKDHDIAVYKHPTRDCIYDETLACCQRKLDDVETLIAQAKRYEDQGYGKHKGLNECGIIFRRHTARVARFNEAWWAEWSVHSRRDQISFMMAAETAGLRVNSIPDYFVETSKEHAIKESGDVEIVIHNHFT
jgi:hypothetical protein